MSVTATKTTLRFSVSVAQVTWENRVFSPLTSSKRSHTNIEASLYLWNIWLSNKSNRIWLSAKLMRLYLLGPVYSGKQKFKGLSLSFSAKRSFLLRNKIMFVSTKHGWSHICPNKLMDSFIRLVEPSSTRTWIELRKKGYPNEHCHWKMYTLRTWSYSANDATKITAWTESKHFNHFFLSDLWPPTSIMLMTISY